MTVKELIAELERHDPNATVLVTWEGTVHEIEPDLIYVSRRHGGALLIDGDTGYYKAQFTSVEP